VEKEGDEAFQKFSMNFTNKDIIKILKNIINAQAVEDLRDLLIRADFTGCLLANAPYIYEELVAKLHFAKQKIEWDKQILNWDNTISNKNDWSQKYIIMPNDFKKISLEVELHKFNEMEYKVLYRSANINFPMADFVYKKKIGKKDFLVAIQVSRVNTVREITMNSVERFCNKIGLNNSLDIKYIYIGPPNMNENFEIKFKNDNDTLYTKKVFHDIEIVRPPPDYLNFNSYENTENNLDDNEKKKNAIKKKVNKQVVVKEKKVKKNEIK
jgi:hypothetical protein